MRSKHIRKFFIILAPCAMVAALAAGEAGAVLTNPSFETGDLTGWTLNDGGTGGDFVTCTIGASDGNCALLLNSGNTPPDAILSQTFATLPGASYELSFDLGAFGQSFVGNVDASVRVELFDAGTLLAGFPLTATDTTASLRPFAPGTFTRFVESFGATGTATELRVSDITGFSGARFDAALDNFAVNLLSAPPGATIPVPAPAGLWLFAGGLGLMVAVGRRRRRALP